MSASIFATPLDLEKNELRNPKIHNLSANPATPTAGQIYFNTTDLNLYVFDGTVWVDLTVQGGGVTYAAPANSIMAGQTASAGVATTGLRSDVVFATSTASATTILGTNSEGTSTAFARADHGHALGTAVVGTAQLADASVTGGTAGAGVKIAAGTITSANIAAGNIDGVAATPSLRTLGTGAQQAAAGNHTHAQLHTQNTDAGTSSATFFLVGTAVTDVLIKKSGSGELSARLGNDTGFAAVQTGALTVNGNLSVTGTTTTINSNTLSVGDNIIELNNDITTTAGSTEDAGIAVKRFTGADVRQDALFTWGEATDRWLATFPASTGTTVVSKPVALKHVETLGVITANTAVTITHGLNTQNVTVATRRTSDNALVTAFVVPNTVDTVQVTFSQAAASGAYVVTIVG